MFQDEANLQRALPTMFQRVTFTQMSLPLRPIFGPSPTQEETEQEGRLLLRDFVSQQIERNHVVLEDQENEEVFGAGLENDCNEGENCTAHNCCTAHELNRTSPSCSSNDSPSSHCPDLDSSLKSSQSRATCSHKRAQRIVVCVQ